MSNIIYHLFFVTTEDNYVVIEPTMDYEDEQVYLQHLYNEVDTDIEPDDDNSSLATSECNEI